MVDRDAARSSGRRGQHPAAGRRVCRDQDDHAMRRCAPTSHKQRCVDDDQVGLEPSLANTRADSPGACDPINRLLKIEE
jgi:hypothetical protein